MKTFKTVLACLLAGALLSGCSGEKKIIAEAAQTLKTYETLQMAYIAEHEEIGTFEQITFATPSSVRFAYADLTWLSAGGQASATLKAAVGECPEGSVWSTCVPNSTEEIVRAVSSHQCASLSPETYRGNIGYAGVSAEDGSCKVFSSLNEMLEQKELWRARREANQNKSKIAEAAQTLKIYETLQMAYIAEHGAIGTFEEITFVSPRSEQFAYADLSWIGNGGQASATLKASVGECPRGSVWSVCVPNSIRENVRAVSSKECASLSPATYQENIGYAGVSAEDGSCKVFSSQDEMRRQKELWRARQEAEQRSEQVE